MTDLIMLAAKQTCHLDRTTLYLQKIQPGSVCPADTIPNKHWKQTKEIVCMCVCFLSQSAMVVLQKNCLVIAIIPSTHIWWTCVDVYSIYWTRNTKVSPCQEISFIFSYRKMIICLEFVVCLLNFLVKQRQLTWTGGTMKFCSTLFYSSPSKPDN